MYTVIVKECMFGVLQVGGDVDWQKQLWNIQHATR